MITLPLPRNIDPLRVVRALGYTPGQPIDMPDGTRMMPYRTEPGVLHLHAPEVTLAQAEAALAAVQQAAQAAVWPHAVQQAIDTIDSAAGRARARFVSLGSYTDQEYKVAERDARDWIAAGQPAGTVPATITEWAGYSKKTNAQAAQQIVDKADALYAALRTIRTARLNGKAAVAACTVANAATPTEAEIAALHTARDAAVAALDGITPSMTGS